MDVNREVIQTFAKIYSEQKSYDKAEQVITDYLVLEKDQDGALWVQLGEVQMEQKKFPQACQSFQAGLAGLKESADRVYANYSLANCYNRGGRTDEAKRILTRTSLEASGLTNSAEQALQLLNSGVIKSGDNLPAYKLKGRSPFRLSAALGTGYDTNVLLVEEDVAKGSTSSDLASFFISPVIQVGYTGRAFKDAFDSRFYSTFTDYTNSAVSSFNSLYNRVDFSFGSGPVRWGLFGDTLFINRSPFNLYSYESGVSWTFLKEVTGEKSTTFEVPLQFQKYILTSGTAAVNDRTGGDVKFILTKRWMKSDQDLLSLQMGMDGQYTTGSNYRLLGFMLPAFWMTSLPGVRGLGLLNTFGAELKGQYYLNSDASRRDLWMKLSAGLAKTFNRNWNVSLDYSGQKNISTVSSARFSKGIIALQLSHDFL